MHYKEVKAILSPQNGLNIYRFNGDRIQLLGNNS